MTIFYLFPGHGKFRVTKREHVSLEKRLARFQHRLKGSCSHCNDYATKNKSPKYSIYSPPTSTEPGLEGQITTYWDDYYIDLDMPSVVLPQTCPLNAGRDVRKYYVYEDTRTKAWFDRPGLGHFLDTWDDRVQKPIA